jgi:Pyruvate/2-oxoacid:ferredoxin oxidoreductase delta subunit
MSKVKRKIIKIDEEKCTGCGECVLSCAEGAIVIKDCKAKVIKDMFCDGLGACLGHCPEGALSIEEREAEPFDEEAAKDHVESSKNQPLHACSSSRPMMLMHDEAPAVTGDNPSQLRNWPIQLHLAPEVTPAYKNASLLIAADCTGFSLGNVQRDFIAGRVAIIGCPKLDDVQAYIEKLTRIFKNNEIKDITLIRMEVPCCGGLQRLVHEGLRLSGKNIPLQEFIVERYGGKVVKVTA